MKEIFCEEIEWNKEMYGFVDRAGVIHKLVDSGEAKCLIWYESTVVRNRLWFGKRSVILSELDATNTN